VGDIMTAPAIVIGSGDMIHVIAAGTLAG